MVSTFSLGIMVVMISTFLSAWFVFCFVCYSFYTVGILVSFFARFVVVSIFSLSL